MKTEEDSIRKRVTYAKLKSYLDQNEEVTIAELRRLHNFLDRNMLYGSRRIAKLYEEALRLLEKDTEAGIITDVTPIMNKISGVKTFSPDPYYALAHRGP